MKTQKPNTIARHFAICLGMASAAIGLASSTHVAQANPLVLNDGGVSRLNIYTRDTNVDFVGLGNDLFPASLPFDQSQSVVHGTSYSQAEYHLAQDGFSIAVSGARSGESDSRATTQPFIFFSVSADTPYQISGNYSADDPGSTAKAVILLTTLTDESTGDVLFKSHQSSFNVVDESFILGELGGNAANELLESLSGALLAGHEYSLLYATTVYASNSGDAATAVGSFRMTFNNVPDAGGTVGLFCLGLIGLSLAKQATWKSLRSRY